MNEPQTATMCEEKHGNLEKFVVALQDSIKEIQADLKSFGQRPTWAYLLLVSTCFAIIGAETMWIIHILGGGK